MGYGVNRGDYGRSARYRGDPGIFGSIFRGITGVAGMIPGPIGVAARVAGTIAGGKKKPAPTAVFPGVKGVMPGEKRGPIMGPGTEGTMVPRVPRKGRRMNVANPRALRKAIRRQAGFVKLAKRALTGSGYTVVSRSSRARRGPRTIQESGPGSVQVR